MTDILQYTSGGRVQSCLSISDNTSIYYNSRDQMAKSVIINATTSNMVRYDPDSSVREFLVTLMLMQEYIHYNAIAIQTPSMCSQSI